MPDWDYSRPDWDQYFTNIAYTVSTRADCRRRRHGAVIVRDHRIVATGYNGAPAGGPSCLAGDCPRAASDSPTNSPPYTNCIAVHAEANAVIYADYDKCRGATIYVTAEPCADCRKLIAGAGISWVVYPSA